MYCMHALGLHALPPGRCMQGTPLQGVPASRRVLCAQGPQGEDLSGGYYEAGGSFLKVGLPEAFPMTELAWTLLVHRGALARVGLLDEALSALKWGTDYLVTLQYLKTASRFMNSQVMQLMDCWTAAAELPQRHCQQLCGGNGDPGR